MKIFNALIFYEIKAINPPIVNGDKKVLINKADGIFFSATLYSIARTTMIGILGIAIVITDWAITLCSSSNQLATKYIIAGDIIFFNITLSHVNKSNFILYATNIIPDTNNATPAPYCYNKINDLPNNEGRSRINHTIITARMGA